MRQGHRFYRRAWFALLAAIAALELVSLVRRREGETMSSYVRSKIRHPVMRGLAGGLLGWLLWHWTMAPSTALGWPDAVATLVGAAMAIGAGRG